MGEIAVVDRSNRHRTFTQETPVCVPSEAKSQCGLILTLRTRILCVVMSRHMTYLHPIHKPNQVVLVPKPCILKHYVPPP